MAVQVIEGYDASTGTFFASAELAAAGENSQLVVFIPQAARMVSFDVSAAAESTFSIYVTNSNYEDAVAEGDSVTWYPTAHKDVTESIFTTKSGCAGAYKVVFSAGSGVVKVRAK